MTGSRASLHGKLFHVVEDVYAYPTQPRFLNRTRGDDIPIVCFEELFFAIADSMMPFNDVVQDKKYTMVFGISSSGSLGWVHSKFLSEIAGERLP